jgi:hypothetical protein
VDPQYWLERLQARVFHLLERRGYHLTRVDYYQPIPDTRTLSEEIWRQRSDLVGLDLRESAQLELVVRLASEFADECGRLPREPGPRDDVFYFGNRWFDSIDAELLYLLIRHFKPRRMIEIGSGYSTLMAAEAARANAALGDTMTQINAIEPYPRDFLLGSQQDSWRLTRSRVEEVPLDTFAQLAANDILFIDSSHVVRIGGDVVYEFLEVIPRLAPGVLVHVHDVFLPDDYPAEWVLDMRRFWSEQYLLRAFLMFNTEFEVLAATNLLHTNHSELMRNTFSSYPLRGYRPASLWMRRVLKV